MLKNVVYLNLRKLHNLYVAMFKAFSEKLHMQQHYKGKSIPEIRILINTEFG